MKTRLPIMILVLLLGGIFWQSACAQGGTPQRQWGGGRYRDGGAPMAAPAGAVIADPVPGKPVDPEKVEVSIAYVKADLTDVLGFLSMASGIPVIVDGEVKGTVTINSVQKVPLTVAYEVINAALRVRGYTMVGTLKDQMIRVVPLKKAFAERADVQVGADVSKMGVGDAVVTQVIPLQYVSASKLREELKALVAEDQASLIAVSSANALVITDTQGNIRRIAEIVNLLDKDSSDVVDVEIYQCKYASAQALVTSLEKVFGISVQGQQRPQGQPNNGQGQPGGPQPNIRTDDGVLSLKGELRIAADERTNSLIISASRQKINVVLSMLAKLDVNTTSDVRAKVFRVQYADAKMVADQLNQLFEQPQGGGNNRNMMRFFGAQNANQGDFAGLKQNVIVADVRTNSVIVTATEQNMQEFESMIKELDVPNMLSDVARIFPLKYARANTVAQTMSQLFRGSNQRGMNFWDVYFGSNSGQNGDPVASLRNITVVAHEKTNTLLVTGPPQAFNMVEKIIDQLDKRTVQVFIEVAIVDVTLDDTTKFGVEWNWANDPHNSNGDSTKHDVLTGFGLNEEKFGLKYSVISSNLKALLHALTTRSDVQVYSTPSITTADNVAAKISIGRDEPFVSSETETSGGNLRRTVDFKNVSITLNVTPHVSEASNLIGLDVQQTINELIGREMELNAPIIANREAKTTVMVNDGQTIVIGGIIKENNDKQTKAVPVLSKLPLLGEFFKSRNNVKQKSELMVFLTPHILRDEASVDTITSQERGKLSDPPKALEQVTTPATTPTK